ncbi:MAG TPA: type II toxin-antitoxin system VapC family toxin [Bryobacteraceae bacterium]|nr:type II toxin-antitoxin system VapC family toxin [Bryobacteraceae bacterium]
MDAEHAEALHPGEAGGPTIYLLDTAPLLWLVLQPEKLSRAARELWQKPETFIAASVVSYWEIVIKAAKGKLPIQDPPAWWEQRILPYLDLEVLPIRESHITELTRLPDLHADPFDRILIAQAKVENMVLVSSDEHIGRYPIQVVW